LNWAKATYAWDFRAGRFTGTQGAYFAGGNVDLNLGMNIPFTNGTGITIWSRGNNTNVSNAYTLISKPGVINWTLPTYDNMRVDINGVTGGGCSQFSSAGSTGWRDWALVFTPNAAGKYDLNIYRDGVIFRNCSSIITIADLNVPTYLMGGGGGSLGIQGTVDAYVIWQRALTASEILRIYTSQWEPINANFNRMPDGNVQMVSPNGKRWYCGVNDAGTWSCTWRGW
jgi:hypothetical protein